MPGRPFDMGLFISVSQIRTFIMCPRKYELKYVRGIEPAFLPVPLAFGTAIHRALAFAYTEIEGAKKLPPLDTVTDVFQSAWAEAKTGPVPLLEDDDVGEATIEAGCGMLAVFYREVLAGDLPLVEAVEKDFVVDLHDPVTGELLEEQLIGTIDLLLREGEHRVSASTRRRAAATPMTSFATTYSSLRTNMRPFSSGSAK